MDSGSTALVTSRIVAQRQLLIVGQCNDPVFGPVPDLVFTGT